MKSKGLHIAIVIGRFNEEISMRLLDGARSRLEDLGVAVADITVFWVPGAFEIPFACQEVIRNTDVDAVITLGAVVQGGTPHFDFVAGECIRGIQQVSLSTRTPISLGVLTTDTYEQALERSDTSYVDHDGSTGDKGSSAAEAAVAMAELAQSLNTRN
ncbi:MAG: 6,7-dimethyl-8-ribityllumazine synthase [Acidimicrobiales bacterium]|jgi:6,7-dimethyl-8-ribityllumazine synthase|nr:6,7-dimethyl-8-ribityllumazine synthase [Acidimicrobiales bacterium]MDP6298514.1 6,7-dimethyl-8-ribityllumazine synthase [Acidimicrobiales bacterium]HJM28732.1 6,7-dimethyl-8-ribityllumazine synthase [Acidimicrobiales bacterium]HJM98262.1 6,7-dimethyl-8-ribityllumazine synthase [Acidimicrobiales bacterium]